MVPCSERLSSLSASDQILKPQYSLEKRGSPSSRAGVWETMELGKAGTGHRVFVRHRWRRLGSSGPFASQHLEYSESPELAARLVEARLRQELRPAAARKTSHSDVEKDLKLFQQLLSLQPGEVAFKSSSANAGRVPAGRQLPLAFRFFGAPVVFKPASRLRIPHLLILVLQE